MPLEVLNLSLRFTTDSTRFTGCHLVAFWFLRRNGTVWTPEVNQQPYVWVVASGETKLQQRKTFDLVLNDLEVDCDSLCILLSDCDVKKGRVMVIPCCRVNLPQSTLLNNFINSVQTSNNEGKQYLTVGSAEWNFIAPQLHSIMTNLIISPGIGEAYIDVDIVNSRFYKCVKRSFVFPSGSGVRVIHEENTGNLVYKSCRNICDSGSGNQFDDLVFPQPTDISNNPVPFTLTVVAEFNLALMLCVKDIEPVVDIGNIFPAYPGYPNHYEAPICCNEVVTYNISVIENTFFLWYQDGDPSSPTFGLRVGKKLTAGQSLTNLKVISFTLIVFSDPFNTGYIYTTNIPYNFKIVSLFLTGITIEAVSKSNITC